MPGMLAKLATRYPWNLVALTAAVVGVWLLGRLIWTAAAVAAVAVLLVATYALARRDLPVLLGRGDSRPWLVRLREQTWPPLRTPIGPRIPRPLAYLLVVLGWVWLLT
ncbi:MAG: hypothetical protein AAGB00_10475 [Planctomycetota bacterium]